MGYMARMLSFANFGYGLFMLGRAITTVGSIEYVIHIIVGLINLSCAGYLWQAAEKAK